MIEKWGEIQGKWDLVRVSGVLPVADLGEEPGGLAPPLFLDSENKFFETAPPLSRGLDDRPPPPLF